MIKIGVGGGTIMIMTAIVLLMWCIAGILVLRKLDELAHGKRYDELTEHEVRFSSGESHVYTIKALLWPLAILLYLAILWRIKDAKGR